MILQLFVHLTTTCILNIIWNTLSLIWEVKDSQLDLSWRIGREQFNMHS